MSGLDDTRKQPRDAGYGRSDVGTFTIPNGADGSLVTPLDLARNYLYLLIVCEDATGIDASTLMTALVTYDDGDTAADMYEINDPGTQWSKAVPASGTFAFALTHALGAQEIQFVLDTVTTAAVTFKVYGIGPAIQEAA